MIPKQLRDHLGIRAGPVEVTVDGGGLRIELPAEEVLVERDGRLVIDGAGAQIDSEAVRALRDTGQR
jgi:bifunctional DNA-binding transcriptional regulator/antitoxin component of YhaV-PrlF toxin-antitoxin module